MRALVCALALLNFAIDLLTPQDIDVSVFYVLSIAACAWLGSPRYLWFTTTTIIGFVFADLYLGAGPLHPDEPIWMILLDRVFDSCALIMLATVVHFWMSTLGSLEQHQRLLEKHVDLLRELQHRVRNDLQVIYIFLDRVARQTGDSDARRSLDIAGRQVMSLGQIYDHLVGAELSDMIDFSVYVKSLCSDVGEFRTLQRPGVELLCRADDSVFLDLNTATALGIVVNELVANAYEHGFPGGDGRIEVSLRREDGDGQALLRIDDDGIGMPETATDSVGLRLAKRWVARIGGTIEVRVGGGTTWSIKVPIPTEGRSKARSEAEATPSA